MQPSLRIALNQHQQGSIGDFYSTHWPQFCKELLGIEPWIKQEAVLEACSKYKKVSVKACPGVGKTYVAGMVALSFFYNLLPCKVITTAPTNRQVEKLLWAGINKLHMDSKVPLGGICQLKQIKTDDPEHFAIGFSTKDTDQQRFQGFHSPNILIIVDEANGVSEEIYTAIDMLMTSEGASLLLIGNPLRPEGTFYQSFKDPSWFNITISAYDSPNVKAGKTVVPGLTTEDWVRDKEQKWGKTSPLFQSLVLGEFPSDSEDALIPLSWIEAAVERWMVWKDAGSPLPQGARLSCNVDPGHSGADPTAIVWKAEWPDFVAGTRSVVLQVEYRSGLTTMELAGLMVAESRKGYALTIDPIGVGVGTYERLKELGIPVTAVVFSQKASDTDSSGVLEFSNLRTMCYWKTREAIDPDGSTLLAIPDEPLLKADLMAQPWVTPKSGGVFQLPSKELIKKKLGGRSPNAGDALAISYSKKPTGSRKCITKTGQSVVAPKGGGLFGSGMGTTSYLSELTKDQR